MIDLAIIGGTGLNNFNLENPEQKEIETVYGIPSAHIQVGEIKGKKVAFVNRHGGESRIPPHKINYRANMEALARLGVKKVVAINAVGGIREETGPLHISVPKQIIDYTWGRDHTFFEGGRAGVNYVDFSKPFSKSLRKKLVWMAHELRLHETGAGFSDGTCYGCTQGPRLETSAEIKRLARDGCDLVGMTMMPEAGLAREKNIEYASICLVVNWAAGLKNQIVTMAEIQKVIQQGSGKILALLDAFIEDL